MFLRSILEISSRRGVARIPKRITTQIPTFLRKELSTNASGKPPESRGSASKVVVGSAVVGGAAFAAYKTGYLDQFIGGTNQNESPKEVQSVSEIRDVEDTQKFEGHSALPDGKEAVEMASSAADEKGEKIETLSSHPDVDALSEGDDGALSQVQDKPDAIPKEDNSTLVEKNLVDRSQSSMLSDDQSSNFATLSEESKNLEKTNASVKTDEGSNDEVQTSPAFTESNEADEKSKVKTAPPEQFTIVESKENPVSKDEEEPSSLLEEYNLEDNADGSSGTSLYKHGVNNQNYLAKEEEALTSALEELGDGYISKDEKLVLDFLQAIHAAERRQAELDARMYAEEKRSLKEKYERELKDAAVRELMLAEEAAMLDKELKRERTKAAAALKSLQEQLEEKYKTELEQKKRIAEQKLKKTEELAKVELAAKIASEKAAQIEKIAEANLHINALCMAFYARSEEARRTHSAHKLALGALALEDALSKGLPIQTEIGALRAYLEGIDKDSILDLVLCSLPDETRNKGTDTLLQLNQKFDGLKGTLRHFSLIPPGGGGILAHSVAHVASWLKVKEGDQSGDGIESLINKVESRLAEGKIAEAADALEEGLRGTEASEIVHDWVNRARNRAITEQALTLLQSYATSISVT